ncbi:MAG: hypothetical protein WC302_03035 [Candidatus Paceibacterota bacterium]
MFTITSVGEGAGKVKLIIENRTQLTIQCCLSRDISGDITINWVLAKRPDSFIRACDMAWKNLGIFNFDEPESGVKGRFAFPGERSSYKFFLSCEGKEFETDIDQFDIPSFMHPIISYFKEEVKYTQPVR